jgi:hypothetical protein
MLTRGPNQFKPDQFVYAVCLLGALFRLSTSCPSCVTTGVPRALRTYAVHVLRCLYALVLPRAFASVPLSRVESGSCVLLVMRVGEVADGWHRAAIDRRGGCECAVGMCMCARCRGLRT